MTGERERQKIQKLVEMGKRVHLLARGGQLRDPELVALSDQLVGLDAQANAHLGKYPPKRGDGVCPRCNTPFEGVFCGGCGLNIDEYFSQPMHTCDVCGLVVEASDIFCGICGSMRGA